MQSEGFDFAMATPDDLGAVCATMLHFAENPIVIAAFSCKFACGVLAIVMFAILFVVKPRKLTLHPNACTLVYAHFVFVFIGTLGVLFNDGFDLFRLTIFRTAVAEDSGANSCGIFAMPATFGAPMRLLTLFGNTGSTLSMSAIAIERTIATLRAKSYESVRSRRIGYTLLLSALVVDIAAMLYVVSFINWGRSLPMQSLTVEAADPATYVMFGCGVIEIFNIAGLVALWCKNLKWKRTANRIAASLSQKYQVEENIQTTSMLIPLTALHCVLNLIAYVLMVVGIWKAPNMQQKLEAVITRDVAPVYDLLLPTFTLIRMAWKKRKETVSRTKPIAPGDGRHFELLNGMFEKALDKHISNNGRS